MSGGSRWNKWKKLVVVYRRCELCLHSKHCTRHVSPVKKARSHAKTACTWRRSSWLGGMRVNHVMVFRVKSEVTSSVVVDLQCKPTNEWVFWIVCCRLGFLHQLLSDTSSYPRVVPVSQAVPLLLRYAYLLFVVNQSSENFNTWP